MDTTGDSQFQCWNLQPRDAEKIGALLSYAQKYEAIEMRQAFSKSKLDGWWYGAYHIAEEHFSGVAYITDQFVYLFGRDKDALRCMGRNLGRNQSKRPGGGSHSLFGPNEMVQAFWHGFEISGKKLAADVQLDLCELTEIACAQNTAYEARYAVKKDLPLVFDFLGEALIDELGMDVRRLGKDAHERRCSELIADQKIILGLHRGKPAFVGEYREDELGIFIEHAYFPVAMRRPKVMRGIHARMAELLMERNPTLLMYIDHANEETKAATDEVGYRVVMPGRMMRLR
ncbi:MAG: hypothetical protein ACI4VB_10050 [Bradymonadia bacterium]